MKQKANLIRALEDAARGRHRQHPLFGSPAYGYWVNVTRGIGGFLLGLLLLSHCT